jgi:hypothetical protein
MIPACEVSLGHPSETGVLTVILGRASRNPQPGSIKRGTPPVCVSTVLLKTGQLWNEDAMERGPPVSVDGWYSNSKFMVQSKSWALGVKQI